MNRLKDYVWITAMFAWILISALWSARSRRMLGYAKGLWGIIWTSAIANSRGVTSLDETVLNEDVRRAHDDYLEVLFDNYFEHHVLEEDKAWFVKLVFQEERQ